MWNSSEQHHHLPLENYELEQASSNPKPPSSPLPSLPVLSHSVELESTTTTIAPTSSSNPTTTPAALANNHHHSTTDEDAQQAIAKTDDTLPQPTAASASCNHEPARPTHAPDDQGVCADLPVADPSAPDPPPDLPVPSPSDNNFFKHAPPKPPELSDKNLTLAQAVAQFTSAASPNEAQNASPTKSSPGSSSHSQSAVHPMLKQPIQPPFATGASKVDPPPPNPATCESSPSGIGNTSFEAVKFKSRSGGRPKDPVWVYFHTNGNGTDERATCKYCGWHVERPKAFRMRDHVASCAQVDPIRRAEMSQLIAFKEAAAAAKQEEKAQLASSSVNGEVLSSAAKKRKIDPPVHPLTKSAPVPFGKSPITSHVLDATSGKPGDDMGIRLDRLTANGFVLIANGTTDADGRCNNLLPPHSRPEVGIYKVTFFSNEFYQKRGIVSFYPFVEITFEIKDPAEHYHIPLLLSPYAFSTYRGS